MTFASPLFAWIAAGGALATIALHLLAWRRPPETPLPTARFVPNSPVRTVSRAVRPADLALLALRVVLLLLVGGALAGPAFVSKASGVARVIVVDRSRVSVGSTAVADSARTMLRAGDALVVFDSVARVVKNATSDSLTAPTPSNAPGSLSAALIVAIRAARGLQAQHDSVEIVVVSPFATEEVDAATGPIRRTWRGLVRRVRAGAPPPNDSAGGRPDVRAPAGDAVAAALALAGNAPSSADVRVIRDAMTAQDTAWARAGHVLVQWPAAALPTGWQRRTTNDTAFAVTALQGHQRLDMGPRAATVVGAFARTVTPPAGRTIARWQDGEPAVTEASLGAGCVRSVGVPVVAAGDLALSPAFRRFASRMVEPCGGPRSWVAAPASTVDTLLASDPRAVGREALAGTPTSPSRLTKALLILAMLAALAELAVRRGSTHAAG
jgi:hypothetical protein